MTIAETTDPPRALDPPPAALADDSARTSGVRPRSSARDCPACRKPLHLVRAESVEIDRCGHCGGAFFDAGEAAALLGPAADPREWIDNAVSVPPSDRSPVCPDGHGRMWTYVLQHGKRSVETHACVTCRGLWLGAAAARNLVDVVREHREDDLIARNAVLDHFGVYLLQALTAVPIEVWNPVRRRPVVLYGLMAALAAAFVYQLSLGFGTDAQRVLALRYGVIPHELLRGYGLITPLTSAFLHGGWLHLLGNAYFLFVFGDNVEDRLGRARFAALYVASLLAATALDVALRHQSFVPAIGASGAISGVMGAYLVLFPRARVWMVLFFARLRVRAAWYLLGWAALNVFYLARGTGGVAWGAHLGGLGCGVALALLFRRQLGAWRRA